MLQKVSSIHFTLLTAIFLNLLILHLVSYPPQVSKWSWIPECHNRTLKILPCMTFFCIAFTLLMNLALYLILILLFGSLIFERLLYQMAHSFMLVSTLLYLSRILPFFSHGVSILPHHWCNKTKGLGPTTHHRVSINSCASLMSLRTLSLLVITYIT